MGEENRIYLIGSFYDFRDKIIGALPQFSFADPRLHRQSSTAKLVIDDLGEAERCPISVVVFPKGKSRGVMTYTELGVAYSHNNQIIVVDENEEKDSVLEKTADLSYNSLDEAIRLMPDAITNGLPKKTKHLLLSKYPAVFTGNVPINRVLISGGRDEKIEEIIEKARLLRPDREFAFAEDVYDELLNIEKTDLLVSYFPANMDWNRHACLLMGAAFAHDISIFISDEHKLKYPPLQAVARRHGSIDTVFDYITQVDDLDISKEALNMYNFFKKEQQQKS